MRPHEHGAFARSAAAVSGSPHRRVRRALPDDLKIRGSTLKFILRELMRDKLPRVRADAEEGRLRHSGASTGFATTLKPLLLETLNQRHRRGHPASFDGRQSMQLLRDASGAAR